MIRLEITNLTPLEYSRIIRFIGTEVGFIRHKFLVNGKEINPYNENPAAKRWSKEEAKDE